MQHWLPLSEITGQSRYIIVSNGNWVDHLWYDSRDGSVHRDGERLYPDDDEYAYMEAPAAPKMPLVVE